MMEQITLSNSGWVTIRNILEAADLWSKPWPTKLPIATSKIDIRYQISCVLHVCTISVYVHIADMRLYRKWNHIGKITRYQKKNAIYLHKIRSEPSLGDVILIFWQVILDQTTIESNIVQQQKEIWWNMGRAIHSQGPLQTSMTANLIPMNSWFLALLESTIFRGFLSWWNRCLQPEPLAERCLSIFSKRDPLERDGGDSGGHGRRGWWTSTITYQYLSPIHQAIPEWLVMQQIYKNQLHWSKVLANLATWEVKSECLPGLTHHMFLERRCNMNGV